MEIRFDLISDARPEELIQASSLPVIATVRTRREGGAWDHSDAACADLLLRTLDAGAAYLDVELGLHETLRKEITTQAGPGRVILSRHAIRKTPSNPVLVGLLEEMAAERPAVVKIVCHARAASDARRVLALVPRGRPLGVGVSAFCTGPAGRASRWLSLLLGASLCYTSAAEGEATAEGQIPVGDMRRRILKVFSHRRFEPGGSSSPSLKETQSHPRRLDKEGPS